MKKVCLFAILSLFLSTVVRAEPAEAEKAAIAAIQAAGGSVRKIAADSDQREVTMHLGDVKNTDEVLKNLPNVGNVVWLNLRGTDVSDAGLGQLAAVTTLTRLHLEKTAVTDAGLMHLKGLVELEYLNLYGTPVTDAGLEQIAELKNLKKIYLWQSKATPEGADKLRASLPNADINMGVDLAQAEPEPTMEPPKTTLAKGNFVKVSIPGENRILSLAEVQVYQTGDGTVLHLTGKATQSSIGSGGNPERAIDDNTTQTYGGNSVTHTNDEKDPWWLLDLGAEKDIGRIKIWNRAEIGERLSGAVIEVLNGEQKPVWTDKIPTGTDGSVHVFETK